MAIRYNASSIFASAAARSAHSAALGCGIKGFFFLIKIYLKEFLKTAAK
jgi:hypothetical protein